MAKKTKSPKEFSQERQKILLDVADEEFLRKGFSGCSIDHISQLSGVSKTTIYRHFTNKEDLFETVLKRLASEEAALVGRFQFDKDHPAETLRQFANHIHSIGSRPRHLEYLRLIISESARLPEITRRAREHGNPQMSEKLAKFFDELIQTGKMRHANARHAATLFYVLSRGHLRPLVAKEDPAFEKAQVDADIDLFLRGTGIE